MMSSGILADYPHSFTCEYMGTKMGSKACDPIEHECVIVPHGSIVIDIPYELRNFLGFRKILETISIEGFIIYGSEGNIYKMRRAMFTDDNDVSYEWPATDILALSVHAALI